MTAERQAQPKTQTVEREQRPAQSEAQPELDLLAAEPGPSAAPPQPPPAHPTAHSRRQSSVLGIQRRLGNAAATRMIQRRSRPADASESEPAPRSFGEQEQPVPDRQDRVDQANHAVLPEARSSADTLHNGNSSAVVQRKAPDDKPMATSAPSVVAAAPSPPPFGQPATPATPLPETQSSSPVSAVSAPVSSAAAPAGTLPSTAPSASPVPARDTAPASTATAPNASTADIASQGNTAQVSAATATGAPSAGIASQNVPAPSNTASPEPTASQTGATSDIANSQPGADGGAGSPQYQEFFQQVQTIRNDLALATIERKKRITEGANAEMQNIVGLVDKEVIRLEDIYDNTIKNVDSSITNARTEIDATKTAKIESTHTSAKAELDRLDTLERDKKEAMQRTADQKASAAIAMGEREAQRAIDGSQAHVGQAQRIKQAKIADLQTVKDGAHLVGDVERRVADVVREFTKAGAELAAMARKRAGEAAEHIRAEVVDLIAKMGQPAADAHTKVVKLRDETINSIKDQAQTSLINLQNEAKTIITNLQNDKQVKSAQVRANADSMSQAVDESVKQAHLKVDTDTVSINLEITRFVDKISEAKWAGPQIESAGSDLAKAVSDHNKEQDSFGTNVVLAVGSGIASAVANLGAAVTAQGKDVSTIGTDFETKASQASGTVVEKMEDARKEGVGGFAEPVKQVEEKLQRGVDRAGEEWERQIKVVENDISHDINDGLRKQDNAIAALESSLDGIGSRARSFVSSIVEAVVNFGSFIVGVVAGMLEHVWDILKDIWDLIKKPLFWIVVVILVVVLIIAIIVFGWEAVVAALAVIVKVLVVAGIIIGVGAAIYYAYLALTKPNLSPYERGKLVGKAIDEIILAFLGTGVWSKLGGWIARVSRIAAFLDKVGDIIKAARILNRIREIEVAIRLIDEIKDAGIILRLLDEINDVEVILKLWRAVGNADDILKLWAELKNADNIVKLWTEIKNADAILKLWKEIADVDNIVKLWKEIKDADTILRLWTEIKDADKIIKLWSAIKDADTILKLWAKIKDADLILKLWDKLADADKLIALYDKVKDGELLFRLLDKVKDIAQLERLLDKVDKAADLEKLLQHLSPQEIEDFITALDDLNLFKQLASKYGGDALKFYGAKFFKEFKGVDADAMKHLLNVEEVSKSKGIVGCHDEGMFLAEMAKPPANITTPPAGVGRGPIQPPIQHPSEPGIKRYEYTFWQEDGKGNLVIPLVGKAKTFLKTTIMGLASDSPKWQASAMEAVEEAIRNLQFPKADGSFTATRKVGLGWSGWYRGGKVQTVFPAW